MKGLPQLPEVALATFRSLPPAPDVEITVDFNPESLAYTVSNTLKEEASGGSKKQFVDKTTAKLAMQVVFDTTDTGEDVRVETEKMATLLKPIAEDQKQVPPNVEFSWGLYAFTGMVEQYKETIDFFAASGVPLRATVDITLSSQDVQFESEKNPSASVDEPLTPEPAVVPGGGGASDVANALGDPRSARAIAAANGSASLRFGAEGGLAVGAGVELKAEAAFSAGASLGAGAGIGIGTGAGAGIGIGGGADAGIGIGAGASAGIGTGGGAGAGIGIGGGASIGGEAGIGVGFGASAGAGVGIGAGAAAGASASVQGVAGGAFAGLRTGVRTSTSMPSPRTLLTASRSAGAVGGNAQFGFGGRAEMQAGASLGADVGAEADLDAMIRFS